MHNISLLIILGPSIQVLLSFNIARKIVGNEAVSKTINSRQKMFTQQMVDTMRYVPGPKYNPEDRNLYYMVGLNDRNFSYDNRMDLSEPANEYPGP